LVTGIKKETFTWQTREMLELTCIGERVLEIGSGSGQTSLVLSLNGRKATALDFSSSCLELADLAAKQLNCNLTTIFANACDPLPFKDEEFDVIFQAGLLEHFEKSERINLLKNWGRAGKRMVSIIPNAASLAYRTGKAIMEHERTWQYGKELPQYSLFQDFFAAGFVVTQEYTIGEDHALNFLPPKHYLRKAIENWQRENICEDNCGQGYLLVTVGKKNI
jgi:SAM-dependent methyltransferase